MNAALILSGGIGSRFASNLPKQYHLLNGRMVIEYVIDACLSAASVDTVMIAAFDSEELRCLAAKYPVKTAPGGETRNRSLKNGLDALNALGCDKVIVLDAVRPLVTPDLISRYLSLLDENNAVATTQAITDSLGCLDAPVTDRSRYYLMQSPEAFRFKDLYEAFDPESKLTEVTQQLKEGSSVYRYFDFPNNPKLTFPWDMDYCRLMLERMKEW